MIKKSLLFSLFGVSAFYFAQEAKIDTVYVFDKQLQNAKNFHKVTTLKTSDLERNGNNLSEVLSFQSPIYIKENGRGMVSSPSFRGTSAQQTAFVWNGIAINSLFLGQGDINNLGLFGADNLEIKAGGGSVLYGSGAIGGSIHMNDELSFNKGLKARLHSEVASYDTYNNSLKASFSNEKFSFKLSGSHYISQNLYEVPEKNYTNWNGQYHNSTFALGISYKLNSQNKISWQSLILDNTQNYVTFESFGNKAKYNTQGLRSLAAWDFDSKKIKNNLKIAFIEDDFQYFGDVNSSKTNGGDSKNYVVKNDFEYNINSKLKFNFIVDYQLNKGEGFKSGIVDASRNVFSTAGLVRYSLQNWSLEGGIKKDFIENISSPLLFSFSTKWNKLNWYNVALNLSKNFRYGSFNDLYWQPGGNLNLKPETSYQVEMIHDLKYKNFKLSISPFYMKISNMIRWLPTNKGYWSVFNTEKIESYGFETSLNYQKKFSEKQSLKGNLGYSYTHSTDLKTKKLLMYVPLYKMMGSLDYQFSFINVYVQGIYNGKVYETSDQDNAYAISQFFVINTGLSVTFLKQYNLGFRVNNITNEAYRTSAYWMPKRNFSVYGTINF